jgi:hypothetical protein
MQPPADDGRSGRILVISMISAAVLLGLVALKFRRPFPPATPGAPTTQSDVTTLPTVQ